MAGGHSVDDGVLRRLCNCFSQTLEKLSALKAVGCSVIFATHVFLDPHCDVADKVGQGQVRVLPTGTC